jgi:uncharacterized LabA/DUF88 family protein
MQDEEVSMTALITEAQKQRVHVFVDYWNFQLELNRVDGPRFDVDFKILGKVLSECAVEVIDKTAKADFVGLNLYISSDMNSQAEAGMRKWASFVDTFPGVNVRLVPRKKEMQGPKCPSCKSIVEKCPHCGNDMRGTQEKGVDVKIATDMITLAWENTYDIGVLVSADSDFVPLAEFLKTKGKKIIHGQLPPKGAELAQKCWARIDLARIRNKFKFIRPPAPKSAAASNR